MESALDQFMELCRLATSIGQTDIIARNLDLADEMLDSKGSEPGSWTVTTIHRLEEYGKPRYFQTIFRQHRIMAAGRIVLQTEAQKAEEINEDQYIDNGLKCLQQGSKSSYCCEIQEFPQLPDFNMIKRMFP